MRSIIIGAGTYGQVYLAYLQEAGLDIIGFLDDNESLWETNVEGIPVLGPINLLETLQNTHQIEAVYCPIGNNKLRVKLLERASLLGYITPNFIHPTVILSPYITIGKGVYVLLGTTIMPYAIIEDFVMISMGVHLAHHTYLSKGTFLSTGVNFGASICAGEYAYVGISATVMTGVSILGKDCLIGAGAVVVKDVPDKAVMAGVPAKILKYKE